MIKKDLLTGETFSTQRNNQVFANSSTRIAYHNKQANDLRQSLAYINKPLRLNHRICIELMIGKKEAVFHKQFLLGKGFNFMVHSHVSANNGDYHYGIYQYSILNFGNDQIKIIKND